jgi:hypothetical protein
MSKAVQFDSYGGINVLEARDVPRPVPGSGVSDFAAGCRTCLRVRAYRGTPSPDKRISGDQLFADGPIFCEAVSGVGFIGFSDSHVI